MDPNSAENPLIGLIKVATNAGEPGLVITTRPQLTVLLHDLTAFGFSPAAHAGEIGARSYGVVEKKNLKDWYDATAQYYSGHITYTDRISCTQKVVAVDRFKSCLLLIICDAEIVDFTPDLRAMCGPAVALT